MSERDMQQIDRECAVLLIVVLVIVTVFVSAVCEWMRRIDARPTVTLWEAGL